MVRRFELALFIAAFCVSTCAIGRRTPPHRRPNTSAQLPDTALASRERDSAEARDADGDGIDDATELSLAQSYFPYFSIDPDDGCRRHGVLFRVTRHPDDPTKVAIWYVVLFEHDCGIRRLDGLGAHVGDDEVFGEIVDPKRPAPEGILAIRAISHQNTTCERITTCGSLDGCRPCTTAMKAGQRYPVVFSSRDKHGNYASASGCSRWLCEIGGCALSPHPDTPQFVNAGEPERPLTRDLTLSGLITSADGWTEPSLMNFDPWASRNFGGAGDVTDDLMDDSFLIAPSGCGP